MSYGNHFMSFKTANFIKDTLSSLLEMERESLKKMKSDKDCPIEIYEKTLDKCKEIEYAIKEMERFL